MVRLPSYLCLYVSGERNLPVLNYKMCTEGVFSYLVPIFVSILSHTYSVHSPPLAHMDGALFRMMSQLILLHHMLSPVQSCWTMHRLIASLTWHGTQNLSHMTANQTNQVSFLAGILGMPARSGSQPEWPKEKSFQLFSVVFLVVFAKGLFLSLLATVRH
jgi:hypothetical protein